MSEANQLDVVEFGDHDTADDRGNSFEDFVDGASGRMFAIALLMTGRNRAEAEDLLQTVLERAFRRWRRITSAGDPEPYVRKMLVNAAIDRWRQHRRRAEQPLEESGNAVVGDVTAEVADRDLLLRALAELPSGQRAVLVLRYFSDLTETETAAALGCSVGSVKSQAARGLAKLRDMAEPGAGKQTGAGKQAGAGKQKGGVLP